MQCETLTTLRPSSTSDPPVATAVRISNSHGVSGGSKRSYDARGKRKRYRLVKTSFQNGKCSLAGPPSYETPTSRGGYKRGALTLALPTPAWESASRNE